MKETFLNRTWCAAPPKRLAATLCSGGRPGHDRDFITSLAEMPERLRVTPLRAGAKSTIKILATKSAPPPLESLVFSRAAFGPTPDDVDTFRGMGATPRKRFEAWVEWQLEPETIDDPELALRLAEAGYQTLDKTLSELWNDHLRDEDDFDQRMLPIYETQTAAILRAIYSRRQLNEVLVDFWHNHFNVYGWHFFAGPVFVHYDRDVIRPNMLGNFREFLEAMTASPAMLFYLDNVFSSADGPNENFARELLELHAMGEESYYGAIPTDEVPTYDNGTPMGYTDEDVRELARCLTGWSLDEENGHFLYRSYWHDQDAKKVLGLQIPAAQGGVKDVRDVLDLLAAHPGVARFVCSKLCRRLVADDPTDALVEEAAAVFLDNVDEPDQLRRVVRTILLSDEFEVSWGDKFKRPFELVISAVRTMGPAFSLPIEEDFSRWFFWLLYSTGNLPFTWAPPTGFPDRKEIWLTTNALVTSWRMINLLTGLELDGWRPCDPAESTPDEVRSATGLADYWIDRALLRSMDANARQEIIDFMAQGTNPDRDLDLGTGRLSERLRSMVGLILMSPEFHWR